MNERVKSMVVVLLAVSLVGLFIASYLEGKEIEEKENQKQEQVLNSKKVEEVYAYSAPPSSSDEPSSADDPIRVSPNTMEQVQDVAERFVQAYFSFDAGQPESYLEQAQPYMTPKSYDFYSRYIRRGTLEMVQSEVEHIELTPGYLGKETQWWNATVVTKTTDVEQKTKETVSIYTLKMVLQDGEWKVDEVGLDEQPNQ